MSLGIQGSTEHGNYQEQLASAQADAASYTAGTAHRQCLLLPLGSIATDQGLTCAGLVSRQRPPLSPCNAGSSASTSDVGQPPSCRMDRHEGYGAFRRCLSVAGWPACRPGSATCCVGCFVRSDWSLQRIFRTYGCRRRGHPPPSPSSPTHQDGPEEASGSSRYPPEFYIFTT